MQGLAVYVKERGRFAWDLSLENSANSYLCFPLALLHSVSCFFPLSITFFVFVFFCLFGAISSNIDQILLINPSANAFVFGDFNVRHKDWLTYSGGTDDLVNSDIIYLSQMTLLRWLTFLLIILTVTLTVPLF